MGRRHPGRWRSHLGGRDLGSTLASMTRGRSSAASATAGGDRPPRGIRHDKIEMGDRRPGDGPAGRLGVRRPGGAPAVSSSMEEATVKGTVTIKGKPAAGGEILFDPANVDRKVMARSAPDQKDGTYTIKTLVDANVGVAHGAGDRPEAVLDGADGEGRPRREHHPDRGAATGLGRDPLNRRVRRVRGAGRVT